ncbi:MAG: hypothetical protein R3A78_07980 [Polyangiales bacterium]|nr:hypothetical protein [Myxococcales bacterium]
MRNLRRAERSLVEAVFAGVSTRGFSARFRAALAVAMVFAGAGAANLGFAKSAHACAISSGISSTVHVSAVADPDGRALRDGTMSSESVVDVVECDADDQDDSGSESFAALTFTTARGGQLRLAEDLPGTASGARTGTACPRGPPV